MDVKSAKLLLDSLVSTLAAERDKAKMIVDSAVSAAKSSSLPFSIPNEFDHLSNAELMSELDRTYPGFQKSLENSLNANSTNVTLSPPVFSTEELERALNECSSPEVNAVFSNQEVLDAQCPPAPVGLTYSYPEVELSNDEEPSPVSEIEDSRRIDMMKSLIVELPQFQHFLLVTEVPGTVSQLSTTAIKSSQRLMKIGSEDVPLPFDSKAVQILVNEGDDLAAYQRIAIFDTIEKVNPARDAITSIVDSISAVSEANKQAENLPQYRKDFYYSTIFAAFYRGRVSGYSNYYDSFSELIKKIDELQAKVQSDPSLLTQLNDLVAQLNGIRQGEPAFFGTEATSGTFVEGQYVPVNLGSPLPTSISPLSLHDELYQAISQFSNEISLSDQAGNFSDLPIDFSFTIGTIQNEKDSYVIVYPKFPYQAPFVGDFPSMSKVVSDFATTGDKTSPTFAQDVLDVEKSQRTKIENSLMTVSQLVENIGKKYGYLALSQSIGYISPGDASIKTMFENESANFLAKLELAKRNLDDAEKSYDDANKKIKASSDKAATALPSGLEMRGTVVVDGTERQIVAFVGSQPSAPPTEDLNFRGNPKPNSPPITSLDYWKKFCGLATIFNLVPLYWPVGLLIPTPGGLLKIPLPITWTPIVVIPLPVALIVIGIGLCGVLPGPFVFVLNTSQIPFGPVSPTAGYFVGAIRPMQQIKVGIGSKIFPAAPIISMPGGTKLDVKPSITKNIPFIKDDIPPYERLSMSNALYLLFLDKWCAAGKKGEGFFENP